VPLRLRGKGAADELELSSRRGGDRGIGILDQYPFTFESRRYINSDLWSYSILPGRVPIALVSRRALVDLTPPAVSTHFLQLDVSHFISTRPTSFLSIFCKGAMCTRIKDCCGPLVFRPLRVRAPLPSRSALSVEPPSRLFPTPPPLVPLSFMHLDTILIVRTLWMPAHISPARTKNPSRSRHPCSSRDAVNSKLISILVYLEHIQHAHNAARASTRSQPGLHTLQSFRLK
jgi:hypothetical protein